MSVENLRNEIIKKESERLSHKRSKYQPKNCTASGLVECLKERYHAIIDWKSKPISDDWLQARFEEGNEQERRILIKLLSNGFEISDNQHRFEIKDRSGRVILTGRIEGKIKYEGKYYPFEIKSMNPNIYAGIDKLEDFEKYSHTQKYPKQLMSYMYNESCDEGFFIITDCLGHFKIITVKLDYAMMEKEIQNCTFVQDCVDKKCPPPFTDNKALCRKCWAAKTCCFPAMDFGEGMQVINDDELKADLDRRFELMPAAKEYDQVDKSIKERVKDFYTHAVCDNYEIIVKKSTVNYKAQEARTIEQKRVSIDRIESDITMENN